MQFGRHIHSTHQTYTLNSPDIHTQFSRHTNSTHTQLTRHIHIIWQTHTLNSPDTHAQLTRQACTVTQGQPWTSCCPCSSVEIDTLSGSRASCWGRTVSGLHTAGTSPTGTGAAQGGQQNSPIRQGGKQNSQIRQGGKQNSTINQHLQRKITNLITQSYTLLLLLFFFLPHPLYFSPHVIFCGWLGSTHQRTN